MNDNMLRPCSLFHTAILLSLSLAVSAQDYNPFVRQGSITPAPLKPAESSGTGTISFETGNTGADTLKDFKLVINIVLSNGVPDNDIPLSALGGTAAPLFTWEYSARTFKGTQKDTIPGKYTGTIVIAYRVTQNSTQADPANGFRAEVKVGPYTSGNITSDDNTSAYTYTECAPVSPPDISSITQPDCNTPTGNISLSGLPSPGSWTLIRYPQQVTSTGSGTTATVTGLNPGKYYFTVTNSAGCVSGNSSDAVINDPPGSPAAPQPGTITQPDCQTPTGSAVINGLPSGTWTLTRSPGNVSVTGSSASTTITGLAPGSYTFRVTNSAGCTSPSSSAVVIDSAPTAPASPNVNINCLLGTGFAVVTVTNGRNGYEYQLDNGNFQSSNQFIGVANGNHVVTVRNSAGCTTTGNDFTVACGCVNGPSISLSTTTGTTCGTAAVTVTGNRFGGSATQLTITTDGGGSVSPATVTSSPFTFTYTPSASDIGQTINLTFTTNNPVGSPCVAATATYSLAVVAIPSAPVPGTVTQPTCTVSTGSVVISGLPSTGTWTLTRNPGNVSMSGSGQSVTIQNLAAGTYTFVVSSFGCVSPASSQVQINAQPPVPSPPVAGTIVQPTCTTATGSITISGLPATGSWTLTRYPGTVTTTGTGTSTTVTLPSGTYNFTVAGTGGCTSPLSSNMVINPQPVTPQPPVPGTITEPTCALPEGRVVLSGLPGGGWTITSIPAGVNISGSGGSATVRGLIPGTYSFIVRNSAGCSSSASAAVTIPAIPNAPSVVVVNPLPVCSPSTVNITAPSVTAGSSPGLTYTYWTNSAGTVELANPAAVPTSGIYYIRGTNQSQCSAIQPVTVSILDSPVADAGPDQDLQFQFSTVASALEPKPGETGQWKIISGTANFGQPASATTTISDLGVGINVFLWTVTNGVCPPATDTLKISVRDLVIPTLITPNSDGKNDFFILSGIEAFQNNQLTIFDRRGTMVFRDNNYNNDWDGVDQHNRPLDDDTYFFVLRTGDGRYRNGYIVIRR